MKYQDFLLWKFLLITNGGSGSDTSKSFQINVDDEDDNNDDIDNDGDSDEDGETLTKSGGHRKFSKNQTLS